jgi:hypothetical protein
MHADRSLDRAKASRPTHIANADQGLIVSTDGHDLSIVARAAGTDAAMRGQVVSGALAAAAANR